MWERRVRRAGCNGWCGVAVGTGTRRLVGTRLVGTRLVVTGRPILVSTGARLGGRRWRRAGPFAFWVIIQVALAVGSISLITVGVSKPRQWRDPNVRQQNS